MARAQAKRFVDKSVVVTGAASGIGLASTKLFAAEGARIIAVDRSPELKKAVSAIKGDVEPLEADAGVETDVAAIMDRAVARHGGLDIVYANAGVLGGLVPLLEITAEQFAEILRINLIGPFLAIKYAAPKMMARGGAIVCTASVAGFRSGAGGTPYSASKAGVINLVQTAAQQLGGTNIRVNAVCPGLIETGMTKDMYERARQRGKADRIGQLNPLRRGGEPEEIADAAAFLASDEASYINGTALVVDGGLSSSHPYARAEPGKPAT